MEKKAVKDFNDYLKYFDKDDVLVGLHFRFQAECNYYRYLSKEFGEEFRVERYEKKNDEKDWLLSSQTVGVDCASNFVILNATVFNVILNWKKKNIKGQIKLMIGDVILDTFSVE